jgi:soluble lytic murein transglycosylase-like protein
MTEHMASNAFSIVRHGLFGIAIVPVILAPAAQAAERVTLSNGFAMSCDHHAELQDHVRLYLAQGEDNYIEFSAQEVARIEQTPNLPMLPASAPVAVAAATNQNTRLSSADMHQILSREGREHNIDVDLLASVIKAESAGNPHARSRAGARGLMQLMPATANYLGVEDSFQPEQNVRGGSTYLDTLLVRYHDNLALALAAYNAGPAAVDKYHGIPPYHETRVYVARVIHEFNRRVLAREMQTKTIRN